MACRRRSILCELTHRRNQLGDVIAKRLEAFDKVNVLDLIIAGHDFLRFDALDDLQTQIVELKLIVQRSLHFAATLAKIHDDVLLSYFRP